MESVILAPLLAVYPLMESPILRQLGEGLIDPMVEVICGNIGTVPTDAVFVFNLDVFDMFGTVDECCEPVKLIGGPFPHPGQRLPHEQRISSQGELDVYR